MRGMALLYPAQITPGKLELVAGWLPGRPWFREGSAAGLERVAAYRFDDPDGEVGIETLLVAAGEGPVHQVPLTYRGAPLDGADDHLIGTTEHSVLGPRWVYDACGDPVYAAALAAAVLADTGQAELMIEVEGRLERREPSMTISGSGVPDGDVPAAGAIVRVEQEDPTVIVTQTVELAVVRRLGGSLARPGATLTGAWAAGQAPVPLAFAVPR
jgi:Maltokinase N-terminal cap domain